jgi:serine protease Do
VTNNHVVDKAKSVEIKTDDGKTSSAKVIGTDSRTHIASAAPSVPASCPHVERHRRRSL